MTTEIILANYKNPRHGADIITLLDCYAKDPMGGGTALSDSTKVNLIQELSARAFAFSLLAYVNGKAAGMTNCFEGFSTFKCKPLINIHDMVVHPDFRGHGLAVELIKALEDIGRQMGACKITLEVLSGNKAAQAAYRKAGFNHYNLDPAQGNALFWEKTISTD